MAKANLTASRLRELLGYDQETGLFTWRVTRRGKAIAGRPAGRIARHGANRRDDYVIGLDGAEYYGHRLAWMHMHGEWPENFIDHIDGNQLNNAIANLRDVPRHMNNENQRNAHKDNKAGLLGVSPNNRRWSASIMVRGVKQHLGTYDTPEEAHAVYVAAKRQRHEGCTI